MSVLVFILLPLKITYMEGKPRYKILSDLCYIEEIYLAKHTEIAHKIYCFVLLNKTKTGIIDPVFAHF